MTHCRLIIVLTILSLLPLSSGCEAGQKLAIMALFVNPGVEEAKVKIITETLRQELGGSGIFGSISSIPTDHHLLELLEATPPLATKEIKLNDRIDYLVGGMVSKLGPESYVLKLKLLEVKGEQAMVISSEDALCDCSKMSLINTARKIATKLDAELNRHLTEKVSAQILAEVVEIGKSGRFVAYSNGTVIDTKSGLMWAAADNGTDINWPNAQKYCATFTAGGYTDWRLPTIAELDSLLTTPVIDSGAEPDKTFPRITPLISLSDCCPWAMETRDSMAAFVNLPLQSSYWDYQTNSYCARALPVRNSY